MFPAIPLLKALRAPSRSSTTLQPIPPTAAIFLVMPETGRLANKVYMTPRSAADLAERRRAITTWAEVLGVIVGRSPDHVAGFLAGFASAPEVFDKGDRHFGENVSRYYREALDESLFVSYVIIPPQIDRSGRQLRD